MTVTNEATNVSVPLRTNSSGEYTYSSLIAGKYQITVTDPGFATATRTHVQVDVDSHVTVDFALTVGKSSDTVTVSSNAQQLSYDSASLGMTIEEKSITNLPLIYGNPFALEFLTPGVTLSGVNPNLHVYDSGTATVSVNGSSLNSLDYKLDGAPDNRVRFSAYTPSTGFVSEYRVDTASYDASQGHSSGGFVNVQTKAGTNGLHGSIFAYYQNPKINANVWALSPTSSKPVFVREGVGVGGPIVRNEQVARRVDSNRRRRVGCRRNRRASQGLAIEPVDRAGVADKHVPCAIYRERGWLHEAGADQAGREAVRSDLRDRFGRAVEHIKVVQRVRRQSLRRGEFLRQSRRHSTRRDLRDQAGCSVSHVHIPERIGCHRGWIHEAPQRCAGCGGAGADAVPCANRSTVLLMESATSTFPLGSMAI